MISRYSLPEMESVFSDESRFGRWVEIELLATEAHSALGIVPAADAATCRANSPVVDARFIDDVLDREKITDHDVAAFVDILQSRIGGTAGGWIHYGLTSSDIVDTAWCWMLRDAADLLIDASSKLLRVVVSLAKAHRDTVMIGRTHGVHAEPTTWPSRMNASDTPSLRSPFHPDTGRPAYTSKDIGLGRVSCPFAKMHHEQ